MPSSARRTSSISQLDAKAAARLSSAAMHIDQAIRLLRPTLSERAPANRIESARQPVETESDSELAAALTAKSRDRTGSSGWVQ
jgi:hypothetical protein